MRILIVSDAWKPQVNGVVRTYEDLTHALEQRNHDCRVIGPHDFPLRIPMPGYREIELALFAGGRLRRMVDDFAPETIHIATEGPLGQTMRKLCLKRGWGFTTAYHTHFPDYAALRAAKFIPALYTPVKNYGIRMIREFHAPASSILTTTQSVEDTLKSWGVKTPMHRLTRGVNTDIFHPGPKTLFQDLPQPVALYVGRVAIEKNIGAFLNASWDGSKVIVGHGPALAELQKKFPKCHFIGRKTGRDLAECFRSADIFAFPSLTDTFGIVLIEAMACGVPIAAFPVTGPKDIVTDQSLGTLHKDLGVAMQGALQSPGGHEQRFLHLKTHYTWDIAADQFISAQNQVVIPQKLSIRNGLNSSIPEAAWPES